VFAWRHGSERYVAVTAFALAFALAACDERREAAVTVAPAPAPASGVTAARRDTAAELAPHCAAVCELDARCLMLTPDEADAHRPRCARSCADQGRASSLVAATIAEIATRCAREPTCAAISACRKKLPARVVGGEVVTLVLPIPATARERFVDGLCRRLRSGAASDELAAMQEGFAAADPTSIAVLTEEAWTHCGEGP
jgi:hypothetical protein